MFSNSKKIGVIILSASFLSACGGGGGTGGGTTPITPPAPVANVLPTVNAGADQVVDELSSVTLAGNASDSDGTVNTYSWAQTSTGTNVTITGADALSASFTAPDVASGEILTFSLTVTDNDGATKSDSISVTINNIDPPAQPSKMVVPEGGTYILPTKPLSSATFWEGNDSQPVGSTTLVNVEHPQFSQALEVDILILLESLGTGIFLLVLAKT